MNFMPIKGKSKRYNHSLIIFETTLECLSCVQTPAGRDRSSTVVSTVPRHSAASTVITGMSGHYVVVCLRF